MIRQTLVFAAALLSTSLALGEDSPCSIAKELATQGPAGLPRVRGSGIDELGYTTWKLPNAKWCTLDPKSPEAPTDLNCQWEFSKFMDESELKQQSLGLYKAMAPCFKQQLKKVESEEINEQYGSGDLWGRSQDGKYIMRLHVVSMKITDVTMNLYYSVYLDEKK